MTVEFHPTVQKDFNGALDHYQAEGGPHLADRFEGEFRACVAAIQSAPRQFSFYLGSDVFRRIRLESFPYIVVYREKADTVVAAAMSDFPSAVQGLWKNLWKFPNENEGAG